MKNFIDSRLLIYNYEYIVLKQVPDCNYSAYASYPWGKLPIRREEVVKTNDNNRNPMTKQWHFCPEPNQLLNYNLVNYLYNSSN